MKTAHSFACKNKTNRPPCVWAQRYRAATQELIAKLREKDYEILVGADGLSRRGIPNNIIVISEKEISPCDIKDDFLLAVRNIRIEHELSLKMWDFDLGEIYKEGA